MSLTTDTASNADYDGTAEIWFDDEAGMATVLGSSTYRDTVFPDERTFLDHENTLTIVGEQVEIIHGQG